MSTVSCSRSETCSCVNTNASIASRVRVPLYVWQECPERTQRGSVPLYLLELYLLEVFAESAAPQWGPAQNADTVLTRGKEWENSKLGKCWKYAWILVKSGERGRNRTFNLLIKSQLLCQLSYAPIANCKVGTNFDYTIGFLPRSGRALR
jgi:hypothetical protein